MERQHQVIVEQHNMEQVYYNKYFAELLIDRRPPPAVDSTAFNPNLPDSLQTKGKKKGLKGLFKNLFKGNQSTATDSTSLDLSAVPDDTENDEGTTEEGGI